MSGPLRIHPLTEGAAPSRARLGPYRIVLIAAVLLAIGTYSIQILLSVAFGQLLQTAILQGMEQYQLYGILDTTLFFVFNPILCFLIFFRLGSMLNFTSGPSNFRLLKYAFAGGLIGYGLCFAGELAYGLLTNYAGVFNADWLVISADFVIGALRGSADILFLAFTGIIIGVMRANPQHLGPVAADSTISATETEA